MNRRKGIIAGLAALMAGVTHSYAQDGAPEPKAGNWWATASGGESAVISTKPPMFYLSLDRYDDNAKVLSVAHGDERIELTAKEIMEALRPPSK